MSIRFACEHCRRVYELPDTSAGRQAKCECGQMLLVPAESTYLGRTRQHEEGAPAEQPPEEEASREPPPLPEEAFRSEPTKPVAEPPPLTTTQTLESTPNVAPEPPATPPPPEPAPAITPTITPAPKSPVRPSLKMRYRNLRAYCVYMRYFAIIVAIGGTLWFLVQGYLLAVMLQQTASMVIAVTSLGSMLMTAFITLAWYVALNAMSEFFQVLMDIEENTRGDA